jgi:HAD superfamily hydrolase (TIGR01459 family)
MTETRAIPILTGLEQISQKYDVLLCDVWGVVHNGREVFPEAAAALGRFRAKGGVVILITNAPRPNAPIRTQVLKFGLPPEAFDAIVTSGDVTVSQIAERGGAAVHHIGPQRDLTLFEEAAALTGSTPRRVDLESADYVLCTGLFDDEKETPEDYEATLRRIAELRLPFICANPDLIVHRGEKLIWCAGALARRLAELGGEVLYCGKPHAPIYRLALSVGEQALGRSLDTRRVLAVGDGIRTDIAGACAQGFDALFVANGIHLSDIGDLNSDAHMLHALFEREELWPSAVIPILRP